MKGKKFESTSLSPFTFRDCRLRSKRSLAEGESSGLGEVGGEAEVDSDVKVWLPEGPGEGVTDEQDSLGDREGVLGGGGLTGEGIELVTGRGLRVADDCEVKEGSWLPDEECTVTVGVSGAT